MAELAAEDETDLFPEAAPGGPTSSARPEGRRRRRRGRGRRRERPASELTSSSPIDESQIDFEDFAPAGPSARPFSHGRAPAPRDEPVADLDDLDLGELGESERESFEVDDFAGVELGVLPGPLVEEEIDLELEQEIRREIEEIEELEREMGFEARPRFGPAEARNRLGADDPAEAGDCSNRRFRKYSGAVTRCWFR